MVNIVGIAIAVAALLFFLAFFRGTYEGVMFASVIDVAIGQAQVQAEGFDEDDPQSWIDPENLFDPAPPSALVPGRSAPRLTGPAFAGDGTRKAPVLLSGVDFQAERAVFSLAARVVEGTFGGPGVTIGSTLAKTLGLKAGDDIRIQARTSDGVPNVDSWKVAAIVSSGYPPVDRTMVLADLAEMQSFLAAEGRVNKLFLRVAPGPGIAAREQGLAQLAQRTADLKALRLASRPWQHYAEFFVEDSKKDGAFFSIFLAILLLLSLSTVAGTMQVTVFERRREIGMLRASGWYRSEIARVFLFEAGVLGLAGGLAGVLAGGAAAFALQLWPVAVGMSGANLDLPAFRLTCDVQAADPLIALAAGFLTALAAGVGPAWKAARTPILSALAEA